jgi:hypothetical protein
LTLLLLGFIAWIWTVDPVIFPHRPTSPVLLLEDSDRDWKAPPFEDRVTEFFPNGTISSLVSNLNICQTVGGNRCLAVSPNGRYFLACEIVGKHLHCYELPSGKELWSIDGEFTAVTVAKDGKVYALISKGLIYGERTVVIEEGRISQTSTNTGFDLVLDEKHNALWLVGKKIKKLDLSLNLLGEISPIGWCAMSADANPDGSIWIAERVHPDVKQSTNRIFHVSADGQTIVKSVYLDWEPVCLRVDPSDSSVWATGFGIKESFTQRMLRRLESRPGAWPLGNALRNYLERPNVWGVTQKFDAEGKPLVRFNQGGHTIDLDTADGSVWMASRAGRLYHYSRQGTRLGQIAGPSSEQKYIVIVPAAAKDAPRRD